MTIIRPKRIGKPSLNEQRKGVMCHEAIMKIAKEMAGIFYERAAGKNNNFYAAFPNQKTFIDKQWGDFVAAARGSLTDMLTLNSVPEDQKMIILDILCLDRTLPKSQSRGIH